MIRFPPFGSEILTPAEMGDVDRLAIDSGIAGIQLMEAAGHAVKDVVLRHHPGMCRAVVLCGPGNNGGDGYAVARLLRDIGVPVSVFANRPARAGSDASVAAARWHGEVGGFDELSLQPGDVVIDALYGAGFKGVLEGPEADAVAKVEASAVPVVAVDLPSGVDGNSGQTSGPAFKASHTVTFFRKKPGHLLFPGRGLCGTVHVADIGIPARIPDGMAIRLSENGPALFETLLPEPTVTTHKYARGSVGIFSGEASSTGAARLSASAAQRAGAGAVTVIAPGDAVGTISTHVTSVMIRAADTPEDLGPMLTGKKFGTFVVGPGFGRFRALKDFVLALLRTETARPTVLDADVFSAFAFEGEELFAAIKACGQPVVMTPHASEFARIFPDLDDDLTKAKHDKAREAAARSGAVIILKGADTVIAAPDGRAAINANGVSGLATAGSGDVLAGFAGGLIAQGMPAFEAACAAVWFHAAAGARLGQGFNAEALAAEILPA